VDGLIIFMPEALALESYCPNGLESLPNSTRSKSVIDSQEGRSRHVRVVDDTFVTHFVYRQYVVKIVLERAAPILGPEIELIEYCSREWRLF
jgi:hypothetical protein